MSRRYCGRVGAAFEIQDGERCPECGYDEHREVPSGECGSFAACPDGDHGHGCTMPPGHEGKHKGPRCGEEPSR